MVSSGASVGWADEVMGVYPAVSHRHLLINNIHIKSLKLEHSVWEGLLVQ